MRGDGLDAGRDGAIDDETSTGPPRAAGSDALLARALAAVEAAFANAPRPEDADLLHPDSRDDGDIAALYGIPYWTDVPDEVAVREYAAHSFLSAAGFRHFLPAYIAYALGNPKSAAYTIESTVRALSPTDSDERLREFTLSKYDLFDAAQASAVVAFLEAMAATQDEYLQGLIGDALSHWRARQSPA